MPKKDKVKRDIDEEVDLMDTMLASLVEILEEKGVISETEWEQKVKKKVKPYCHILWGKHGELCVGRGKATGLPRQKTIEWICSFMPNELEPSKKS